MESTFREIVRKLSDSLLTNEGIYTKPIEACIAISAKAIEEDRCIFVCGNGGSASTASHIANDMMCHMRNWKRKGYRMMSLNDNVSVITSLTNDYGFDEVFSKQISVFGNKGDVLWAFSTSGNSKNCIAAIETAKRMKITTVGFTGMSGGKMKELCDIWIPVCSDDVTRVEELHMIYAHIIGENVEAIVSPMDK